MNYKKIFETVSKVFTGIITVVLFAAIVGGFYIFGYFQGKYEGQTQIENFYTAYVSSIVDEFTNAVKVTPTPLLGGQAQSSPTSAPSNSGLLKNANWGGPDLWEAVNARRIELGVNPLNQKDNLCTIASIRLNELLELGKLDGHEGFSNMTERRPDLVHVFESYSTVAEFLAAGGDSAIETVSLWENSLGHKKIVTGGEYVWGCIYAQNSFAVAITAF